jgi:hypothetical protein
LDDPGSDQAGAFTPVLMERLGAGLRALAGFAVAAVSLMPPFATRARRSRIDLPSREAKR